MTKCFTLMLCFLYSMRFLEVLATTEKTFYVEEDALEWR